MIKNAIRGAAALALAAVGTAHAALPTEVGTSITSYKEDALSALGLVMAAGVAIWGLNKLAIKLGWK